MTDQERLELLWIHYHRQIDENLAVHRSLEDIREILGKLENLVKDLRWRMNEVCNHLSMAEKRDD